MTLLQTLSSATSLAAARTSQEAVVFHSLANTGLPDVIHLEDEEYDEEEKGEKIYYVDDMTEAEYLMQVVDPEFMLTVNNDAN